MNNHGFIRHLPPRLLPGLPPRHQSMPIYKSDGQPYTVPIRQDVDVVDSTIASKYPKDWKNVSVKHKRKLKLLKNEWRCIGNGEHSKLFKLTIINDNGVCFDEIFLIGSGNCGTEVYVCLGTDGIERAIKRLPKSLCKLLKNERNILTSPNAVESPRIVNYCFYDDTSSPEFGYLILNLYEQNLEEFVEKEGETITESRARKMIRQVLEGLKALHAREPRILHRDLKPTNVLVDVNGDLVLSDFGIGRFLPQQGILLFSQDLGYICKVADYCLMIVVHVLSTQVNVLNYLQVQLHTIPMNNMEQVAGLHLNVLIGIDCILMGCETRLWHHCNSSGKRNQISKWQVC